LRAGNGSQRLAAARSGSQRLATQVGEFLEARDELRNTFFVYTSDHGTSCPPG
jgi:hypothetical protein